MPVGKRKLIILPKYNTTDFYSAQWHTIIKKQLMNMTKDRFYIAHLSVFIRKDIQASIFMSNHSGFNLEERLQQVLKGCFRGEIRVEVELPNVLLSWPGQTGLLLAPNSLKI